MIAALILVSSMSMSVPVPAKAERPVLAARTADAVGLIDSVLARRERPEPRVGVPSGLGYGAMSARTMTLLSGNVPLPKLKDAKQPLMLGFDASIRSATVQIAGAF